MEGADVGRAAALCIVHDTPETRVGDVPAVGRAYVTTASPEAVSVHQTSGMPDDLAAVFQELVRAYETDDSIESRLAHDADKIETLLQPTSTKPRDATSVARLLTRRSADRRGEAARRRDPRHHADDLVVGIRPLIHRASQAHPRHPRHPHGDERNARICVTGASPFTTYDGIQVTAPLKRKLQRFPIVGACWSPVGSVMAGIASGAMDANAWLIDLSERSATRFFDTPFAQLTNPEQVFVAVWTLEADVNNGGFDQYYLNSSGDHAWYAPAALRAIGAEQTAAIAQRANDAFGPDGPPPDRDARLAAMDNLPEEVDQLWDDCDQAFYAYPHDLTALLSAYVQSHRSEIQGAA